jgi:signal peptidase I
MLKQIIDLLLLVGSVLALPVVLVCLYDKFIAEPKRPRDEDDEPADPPTLARWAYNLLPWVLIAAAVAIGVRKVFGWAEMLVIPLSYLAVPLVLLAAYDKWVLAPQRPRKRNGEPKDAPWYMGLAYFVLPFALLAVAARIGMPVVFAWLKDIAEPLSYAAVPVGLWCFIDSWFLAPRRHILAGTAQPPEPPALTRIAYLVLPVLLVAIIVRMITAETLDFSLVLFLLSVGTGLVWAIDHLLVRKRREAAAKAVQPNPIQVAEPGTVDYARSFFPVALVVLIVRAFIFEPFRIPSDSMMPTLLDGDFIVVNKYAYGLRWPVLNTKIVEFDSPQRGDVVVFRYPPDPKINFIKRLVGVPGDRVQVVDDQLVINGETIPLQDSGRYTDGCYVDLRLSTETIGNHTHKVMSCRTQGGLIHTKPQGIPSAPEWPVCDRKAMSEKDGHLLCRESGQGQDGGDSPWFIHGERMDALVVPAGFYVAIGDNRDNSSDSRVWGLVPEQNLVGKATRIWFNFDLQRSSWVDWNRIGQGIE